MSSGFVCVIKRLVMLWGSLSKPWYVMATNGESKEDSLHLSIDRDGQQMVRRQRSAMTTRCPSAGETHALQRTGLGDDIGGYSDSRCSGSLF